MIWTSMLLGAALYLVGFALGTWLILTAWNASTALGVVALIVIGSMMLGGLATYVQRIAVALENRAMGRDWRSGLLGGIGPHSPGALALIRHHQKLMAFQQLVMETYNDALYTSAQAIIALAAPLEQRSGAMVTETDLVERHVLRAIDEKLLIIDVMRASHAGFPDTLTPDGRQLYGLFSELLDAMEGRAAVQLDAARVLIERGERLDTSIADQAEQIAFVAAVTGQNALIAAQGLEVEEFIGMNHDVFNEVRFWRGLPSLSKEEFNPLFIAALSGAAEQVRLFA